MSSKKPKSMRSLLLGKDSGLGALVDKARLQVALRDQVADALPEDVRCHIVAANIEDDTLTVVCDSAPWATRVRFYSQSLLDFLATDHNLEARSLIIKVRPHRYPERDL